MCFDAKQSWQGEQIGKQRDGQVDIAPKFDMTWTSALVTCEWYLVEGARPIYMPEAFDLSATRRDDEVEQDIGVSFVGKAYGFRPNVIRRLRRAGIDVKTFGRGWEQGWIDDPIDIFNRSLINIGMGGIGYSGILTNVKGRDFEIPAIGNGVYLTSFNPDLARHYEVGQEILCYRNQMEMTELIRYYLSHPKEARQIARRGRERCLAEHRWLHRYKKILNILGVI
jgi:spore maturation protein CgeB